MLKRYFIRDALSQRNFALFTRFVLSYIVILLIPFFVVGIFIYRNFNETLYKEVESTTLASTKQTIDNINMRIKEFRNITLQISKNSEIEPSLFMQNINRLTEFEFYKIIGQIKNIKLLNAYIDNTYVYYRDSDTIVSSESKYNFSIFFSQVFTPVNASAQDIRELMNTVQAEQVRTVQVRMGNTVKEQLIYLKPLPVYEPNYNATLMITMDTSSITAFMKNILGSYDGSMYILDYDKNIVNYITNNNSGPLEAEVLSALMGDDKEGVYSKKVNGENKIISYNQSEETRWSCIAILDAKSLMAGVNAIRGWIWGLLFLSIVIGLVLAYYFSYNHYNPIKKVAALLTSHAADEVKPEGRFKHELDMIENAMSKIISKDKLLQNSMNQYKPVVQADFLRRILKGEFSDPGAVFDIAEFTGVQFGSEQFAAMVINIDNSERLLQENNESLLSLYRFSVSNVAAELCESFAKGYTVDMSSDRIALVVDFSGTKVNCKEVLKVLGDTTRDFFHKNFEFTVTVGIGKVYKNLTDLAKSYIEAQSAVEYKIVKGNNSVIHFDNISTGSTVRYFYTLQHEQRIFECLKKGDFSEIQSILGDIIVKITNSPVSVNMAQCIYFDIINTAMKSLAEFDIEDYSEMMRSSNILQDLLKCRTLQEVYDKTVGFYEDICGYIKRNSEYEAGTLNNDILAFVKSNCFEVNLSLSYLADRFSVSQSYLSRFFKSRTEMNFIDYLHTLRLVKVKHLLTNSQKTINEIAMLCGYIDNHSLIRVFRKYEGITPGRYREMYCPKGN